MTSARNSKTYYLRIITWYAKIWEQIEKCARLFLLTEGSRSKISYSGCGTKCKQNSIHRRPGKTIFLADGAVFLSIFSVLTDSSCSLERFNKNSSTDDTVGFLPALSECSVSVDSIAENFGSLENCNADSHEVLTLTKLLGVAEKKRDTNTPWIMTYLFTSVLALIRMF